MLLTRVIMLGYAACILWATATMTASSSPSNSSGVCPSPFENGLGDGSVHATLSLTSLRVMTFNVWVGGALVDFGNVVQAIRQADADVVGLQEVSGNAPDIAALLGWSYVDVRTNIISRLPLMSPPSADGKYVYVQLAPGQVVAVANVHLPSSEYGPYALRDGADVPVVLKSERRVRGAALRDLLPPLLDAVASGVPIIVTGDFNTPSHLDWISAAVGVRPYYAYAVLWPTTVAMSDAGFLDTYRAAHPDPVKVAGVTWTRGYPHPRVLPDEVIDRIDYVFVNGANASVSVLSSDIVGPACEPDVAIAIDPWPSDHLAVVSTIELSPVEPEPFVAVSPYRVEEGSPFNVHYHAPIVPDESFDYDATPPWEIVIETAGDGQQGQRVAALPPYEARYFGTVGFGASGYMPGKYAAVLTDGDSELSRAEFWVVSRGASPRIEVEQASFAAGTPVSVSWHAAMANRADWIGIYPADGRNLYADYTGFVYTNASVSGEYVFGAWDLGDDLLAPGNYTVHLMVDDGYASIAQKAFVVGAAPASGH